MQWPAVVNGWQNRIIYNNYQPTPRGRGVVNGWQNRIIYNAGTHQPESAIVVNGWQNRIIYNPWCLQSGCSFVVNGWQNRIIYNARHWWWSWPHVVNGWQNRIIYNVYPAQKLLLELWMADKIVSYTTSWFVYPWISSCEWLTKPYHIQRETVKFLFYSQISDYSQKEKLYYDRRNPAQKAGFLVSIHLR